MKHFAALKTSPHFWAQRPPSPPAQQIKKSDWKDVQSVGPHQRPLGQRGRLCVEWRRGWRVQGWEAPPVAQVQVTSPPPHQASPLQASSSSEQVSESSRSISHLVGSMVAFWVCKVLLFTIQVIIIKNNREFMERFQRLKVLYNLIKEKRAMHKYPHTKQWYRKPKH